MDAMSDFDCVVLARARLQDARTFRWGMLMCPGCGKATGDCGYASALCAACRKAAVDEEAREYTYLRCVTCGGMRLWYCFRVVSHVRVLFTGPMEGFVCDWCFKLAVEHRRDNFPRSPTMSSSQRLLWWGYRVRGLGFPAPVDWWEATLACVDGPTTTYPAVRCQVSILAHGALARHWAIGDMLRAYYGAADIVPSLLDLARWYVAINLFDL